jgi:hypothetical protein
LVQKSQGILGINEPHEGYVFGQIFGFEISIDFICRPYITTNQPELHLDNANKLFNLIKHDGAIFLPLVLNPLKFKKKIQIKIYFVKEIVHLNKQ